MKISEYLFRLHNFLLLGLLTFFSVFAAADTNFIFVDQATNLCLDSDGNNVYTHVCNGGVFQVWTLQNDGVLHNTASSNQSRPCLDSNSSGNVYPNSCNGGDFQKWQVKGSTLVNKATGLALDSNSGGSVYTMSPNGGSFQNWTSKQPGASSGCSDFYVNSNGSCVYAGYSKCPTNGHWDSAVRSTGGCACNTGFYWDGSKCSVTQAVGGESTSSVSTPSNSNCQDFYVLNPNTNQCEYSGYNKCPTNGHWDKAVRGVGGCACDSNYTWDGSKCVILGSNSSSSANNQGTNTCQDFYVLNPNTNQCEYSGYNKCPTNGHWDKAVRGVGGCACDSSYTWDGSKCVISGSNSSSSSSSSNNNQNNSVELYTDYFFQGSKTVLAPGKYDDYQIPVKNISSLKISKGLRVILYQQPHFSGQWKDYYSDTNDVGDFMNDQAQSVMIATSSWSCWGYATGTTQATYNQHKLAGYVSLFSDDTPSHAASSCNSEAETAPTCQQEGGCFAIQLSYPSSTNSAAQMCTQGNFNSIVNWNKVFNRSIYSVKGGWAGPGNITGYFLKQVFGYFPFVDGGYQVRVYNDQKLCMNVKGSWPYDGGEVITYPCTNTIFYPVNEQWNFVSDASGQYVRMETNITDGEIRKGMCAEAGSSNQSQLWNKLARNCEGNNDNQLFTLLPVRGEKFMIYHKASEQCLKYNELGDGRMRTANCDMNDKSQWVEFCKPGQDCVVPPSVVCQDPAHP